MLFDNYICKLNEFYALNKNIPNIGKSFGYFVDHPFSSLNVRRLRFLYSLIDGYDRNKQILEIGCGGGILLNLFQYMGFSCLGVDIDEDEIALAKKFSEYLNCGTLFCCSDIYSSDIDGVLKESFPNTYPDIVLFAYSLHHLPDVDTVAGWISGWGNNVDVIVNEENPRSIQFRLKHLLRGIIQKDTESEHQETFEYWSSIFNKHGFNEEFLKGIDLIDIKLVNERKKWSVLFKLRK